MHVKIYRGPLQENKCILHPQLEYGKYALCHLKENGVSPFSRTQRIHNKHCGIQTKAVLHSHFLYSDFFVITTDICSEKSNRENT
jgi:hypothetical protein